MISDKLYEQIEKYSNNEMTSDEKKDFEALLNKDSKLQKIFQVYQELPDVLQHVKADQAFRQQVITARESFENAPKASKFPTLLTIFFLLIILIGGLLLWSNNISSEPAAEEQIFAYWNDTEQPALDIKRSTTVLSEEEQIYESAFIFFNNQRYDSTITLLNQIQPSSSVYLNTLKLKGYSQYKEGNYQAAITTFQTYLSDDNSQEKDLILWYQAFAYLKSGQNANAKSNFETIVDKNYSKATDAKAIISLLKTLE